MLEADLNIDLIKVDIVMATYNGHKYLQEQITSIILQSHKNWRLLISDDASSDKTIEIIKKNIALDSRISLVNCVHQGGVVENFNKALKYISSDYVMFCDQDDFWLEDKISIMLGSIVSL